MEFHTHEPIYGVEAMQKLNPLNIFMMQEGAGSTIYHCPISVLVVLAKKIYFILIVIYLIFFSIKNIYEFM